MDLTLKDRFLILNSVLPQFDTRANMILKIAIGNKIQIIAADQARILATDHGNGQLDIAFRDAAAMTEETTISFTNDEIEYLKGRVDYIDRNGMFSEFNLGTYNKIIDEPLIISENDSENTEQTPTDN